VGIPLVAEAICAVRVTLWPGDIEVLLTLSVAVDPACVMVSDPFVTVCVYEARLLPAPLGTIEYAPTLESVVAEVVKLSVRVSPFSVPVMVPVKTGFAKP
jgi:hypothetical protein